MTQTSIIPSVPRAARYWRGSVEARWPLQKTVTFVFWTSAALWAAIFLVARALTLAVS